MFYVDRYAGELVKEKDKFAAPERYYEYRKGVIEGLIVETYIVGYRPLELLDFAYAVGQDTELTYHQRKNHFERNGISGSVVLYAYTVPPSWYEEAVSKYEEEDEVE